MASFRTLRPFGKRPASAGRSTVLGLGSPAAFAVVISLVAAALLAAIQLAKPGGQADRSAPSFLIQALGLPQPDASLHRKPARGVTATVRSSAFRLSTPDGSVSLGTAVGSPWTRHANGASRTTSFGQETVVFKNRGVEQFLTVERRLGLHAWSWQLADGGLRPRVGEDG